MKEKFYSTTMSITKPVTYLEPIKYNFNYNTSNFICNYYNNKSDCDHYMCKWDTTKDNGTCIKPEGDFCNKIEDEHICNTLLCKWDRDINKCTENGSQSKLNKECLYYSSDKNECKKMGCRVLESVGLNDSELCVSQAKYFEDVNNQLCLNFKPKYRGEETKCPYGCVVKNIKIKDGNKDICIKDNINYECGDLLPKECINERNKLFCRFDGNCKKNI